MSEASGGGGALAITGSGGFIGSHLMGLSEASGRAAIGLARDAGLDVTRYETLSGAGPFDTLIHLAARTYVPDSYTDPRGFYETNVLGTLNCLELCRARGARMVLASTYVYGRPRGLPVSEAHPTDPWNPYAASKLMAEALCHAYHRDFGVDSVILRIFNPYGPGHGSCHLIPTIVRGLMAGRIELMHTATRRDFVYVGDVARALLMAADYARPGVHVFNIGSGASHSIMEMVDALRRISGRDAALCVMGGERPADIPDVVADIARARESLGWAPLVGLDEGLALTLGGLGA